MKSFPSILSCLACLPFLVAGCSTEMPTKISQNKPQIEQERVVEQAQAVHFNEAQVGAVAHNYRRNGEGPLELTVTYDPASSKATAMHASNQAADLVEMFRKEGVENVEANILPVKNSGESKVMVAYDGYNVLAPADCDTMAGLKDRNVVADEDYKLGCTVDTLLTQQIVRPKDLAGREDTNATTDGRRVVNGVEGYRSGVPSTALNGESASGG